MEPSETNSGQPVIRKPISRRLRIVAYVHYAKKGEKAGLRSMRAANFFHFFAHAFPIAQFEAYRINKADYPDQHYGNDKDGCAVNR